LLDTANASAIRSGLQANCKTAIINGFSLEPKKLKYILPLAKEFNVDIIGYLLYPNGHVPFDSVSRLNVAVDLYTAFSKYGPEKERLIIDPVLTPVMWQQSNKQAGEILSVISALPEVLGYPVKTIAALSNLTSGNKVKKQTHSLKKTYLPMLAASGLSMLMLNIFHDEQYRLPGCVIPLPGQASFPGMTSNNTRFQFPGHLRPLVFQLFLLLKQAPLDRPPMAEDSPCLLLKHHL